MNLFYFEPGDDTRYRVLFGTVPGHLPFTPQYTLFGFAEGDDPLITLVFGDPWNVTFDDFAEDWRKCRHAQPWGDPEYIERAAYNVFQVLVGRAVDGWTLRHDWSPEWQSKLLRTALSEV